jgi:ribosomal protein L32E
MRENLNNPKPQQFQARQWRRGRGEHRKYRRRHFGYYSMSMRW